jgi:hypothetical protein
MPRLEHNGACDGVLPLTLDPGAFGDRAEDFHGRLICLHPFERHDGVRPRRQGRARCNEGRGAGPQGARGVLACQKDRIVVAGADGLACSKGIPIDAGAVTCWKVLSRLYRRSKNPPRGVGDIDLLGSWSHRMSIDPRCCVLDRNAIGKASPPDIAGSILPMSVFVGHCTSA